MSAQSGQMNVLSSYASYISGYLPETIKDAAGLTPQISEDVRHITWLTIERIFCPLHAVRLFLVIGYQDGFQIYDVQDPTNPREVLSKQAAAVFLARLLPAPMQCGDDDAHKPGAKESPMLAYLDRGAPARVKLFSMRAHDDVSFLRLTEPAKSLQAGRRFFAVGLQCLVEIYDALTFEKLFSVQCAGTCPTFALGNRWLAYNLPPQQPAAATAPLEWFRSAASNGSARAVLKYVKQVGQRTFDEMLMPPADGGEAAAKVHCGIVAVRDASSKAVIAQFNDHSESIGMMVWDPSGLQLVSVAASGHCVLVHRALVGADVQGDFALGAVVIQHLYTLYRGCTPAVISHISVSDDGKEVAVSSAKGTAHVYRLPTLHSAALGHYLAETGDAHLAPTAAPRASAPGLDDPGGINFVGSGIAPPKPINVNASTRVKLGSIFMPEGLMPQCGFINTPKSRHASGHSQSSCSRICVATRAGTLALYKLSPRPTNDASTSGAGSRGSATGSTSAAPGASRETGEWQATCAKEVRICRPLRHFRERRFSPNDWAMPGSSALLQDGVRERDDKASACGSPVLRPLSSPQLGPRASPAVLQTSSWSSTSPPLGPRSHSHGPRSCSPPLRPRTASAGASFDSAAVRAASPARASGEEGSSSAPLRWEAQIETVTYAPMDLPIWHCPQLSFHTYPSDISSADLNATLRSGTRVSNCKELTVSRPEKPSDRVHCSGVEHLPELFVGALGSAVGDAPGANQTSSSLGGTEANSAMPAAKRAPALVVAPAWGSICGQGGGSLLQEDGIGSGLEDLEEDWLKA